jgi:DNA replication protein DnaC
VGEITDPGGVTSNSGVTSNPVRTLPPLPPSVRTLTTEESDALQEEHPSAPRELSSCPTCGGSGTFLWWYDRQVDTYECSCSNQIILSRFLLWSGVAISHQRLAFSDLSSMDPQALAAASNWMEGIDRRLRAGHGLLFTGPNGNGKTALAVLLLKSALGQGYSGFFTTFDRIIEMMLSKWRQDADAARYHSRCRNAPLLVIDDVGREMKQRRFVRTDTFVGMKDHNPASAEFALESILRYRAQMALPTIITTNLSVEDMGVHYGIHFASLLTETTIPVEVRGDDWRTSAFRRAQQEITLGLSRPVVIG